MKRVLMRLRHVFFSGSHNNSTGWLASIDDDTQGEGMIQYEKAILVPHKVVNKNM